MNILKHLAKPLTSPHPGARRHFGMNPKLKQKRNTAESVPNSMALVYASRETGHLFFFYYFNLNLNATDVFGERNIEETRTVETSMPVAYMQCMAGTNNRRAST